MGALSVAAALLFAPPVRSDSRLVPAWVLDKPRSETQVQKSVAERGTNPCLTQDPGFGNYSTWSRAPAIGQMIIPRTLGKNDKTFDVVFHFHGHEAARKEWVQRVDDAVLVGIDLGNGSGAYLDKFSVPGVFEALVASVERGVREHVGNAKLRVGHMGLTSWSAGYGAVLKILSSSYGKRHVDAVALFDGLHTGYVDGQLHTLKLEPLVDFANLAARGERVLYVSHSSIIPPGYASTTETANYLIWRLGGKPETPAVSRSFPLGLDLISSYSRGKFTVRGFRGNGQLDHCAHFGILGDVVRGRFLPHFRNH